MVPSPAQLHGVECECEWQPGGNKILMFGDPVRPGRAKEEVGCCFPHWDTGLSKGCDLELSG